MEASTGAVTGVKPFRPGVFTSYGNGWRQLWKFFLPLFLIGIIYFVIQAAVSVPTFVTDFSMGDADLLVFTAFATMWAVITVVFSIFISNPLGYGQNFAYLKASRGDNVEIGDLFAAFKNYWNAVGASILVGIIVGIGFLVLIVPGIYLACKLAFVPYLIVDKKSTVGKAIGESWRMASHGIAWKVFLMGLLAIPIVIAGLICLLVGVIISFMWISTAFASLYHAVDTAEKAPSAVTP
jgi:hypothetical protein